MTPRERVKAALDHNRPDRIPRYDVFFQSFIDQWRESKHVSDARDIYSDYPVDIPRILANQGGPFWKNASTEYIDTDAKYIRDSWGRLRKWYNISMNVEVLEFPIKEKEDLDKLDFGNPKDITESDEDRLVLDRQLNDPRFAPVTGVMGLYHACTWLRGDVPFLMDLVEDEVFCHALIDRIGHFLTDLGDYMLARTNTYDTAIWVYDDFSTNRGPMISPAMFEEFFLQPYKRMFAHWKSKGASHVFVHHDIMAETCYPIVDLFLDAGLTGVQGVYPTSGLTLPAFKVKYGKKLSIIGGMCNTHTLPFGTKKEIEKQARDIMEVAKDGGVIIGSHSIEGYIPVENYDYYQTALAE